MIDTLSKSQSEDTSSISSFQLALLFLTHFLAIVGAEILTVKISEEWGVSLYFCILVALILSSSSLRKHKASKVFTAMRLIPIYRIIRLSLPLHQLSSTAELLIVSILMLIAVIMFSRFLEYNIRDVGLTRGSLIWQIGLLFAGAGFSFAAYNILEPDALIVDLPWQRAIFPAFVLIFSLGFIVELVFRGILQHSTNVLGRWGWTYVAILYAAIQIEHLSPLFCALSFFQALFYGWVVQREKSILGVTLAQGAFFIGLYWVFPTVL